MLTMYVKTGCPYCALAISKVDELGLEVDYKNIADDAVAEELIARGGKRMVPYLIDDKTDTEMYESADIADYLGKTYGSGGGTSGEASEEHST